MHKKVNHGIYIAGIVLFFFGLVMILLYHLGIVTPTKMLYPCVFHRVTGLYCPGCGGTRAVEALLQGDFFTCLRYHPFVLYCFILYVVFMLSHTIEKITKKKAPQSHNAIKGLSFQLSYVYIGILIILIQWMIKNIILILK